MVIIASLILAGTILMLIEMLLIPGVGVAGIFSLASMAASCWYAFHTYDTKTGIIVIGINCILLLIMLFFILREKTWKKFELESVIDSKVNSSSDQIKAGDRGFAETRLAPMGTARFGEISCEVKSEDNSMIDAGTEIEIVRTEDRRIIVKSVK